MTLIRRFCNKKVLPYAKRHLAECHFTECRGSGWKPTHLTSVFSLQTSVTSPHGTTLKAFADVKYRCLRVLDRLVSTLPLAPYLCRTPRCGFRIAEGDALVVGAVAELEGEDARLANGGAVNGQAVVNVIKLFPFITDDEA